MRKFVNIQAWVCGICIILTALLDCCTPAQPYQYIQSPSGQTMVVVHDGGSQFVMEAAAFQLLMNSGGYNNVITHYHHYPAQYGTPYNPSTYGNWHSMPSRWTPPPGVSSMPRDNGFRASPSSTAPTFKNTSPTPVRTNSFRSNLGSSKPTFIRTSPSYSAPRTSGFRRR